MNRRIVPINEYNINLYEPNQKEENEDEIIIKNLFWYTHPDVLNKLILECKKNNFTKILEIGPGKVPFPVANIFIGYNESIKNYIDLDIDENVLPFEDKEVDFIYCRHVLEDIQNPNFALKEIMRVSKSFYIETPSPLVEITKNIDGHNGTELYCGYIHHRYIIWYDIDENTIHFLPKYGFIENLLNISDELKRKISYILNNYPVYWNTYLYKKNDKENINININMHNHLNLEEYPKLLLKGIESSIKSTNYFINTIVKK